MCPAHHGFQIIPTDGLPPDERRAEAALIGIVQDENADSHYNAIPLTFNGLIINIDLYRELLPDYRLSDAGTATPAQRENRTRFTAATYAAAKAGSFERYRRSVAAPNVKRAVLFGGGPASGKTSLARSVIESIDPTDTVVYDTSLTDPKTAEREIRQAHDRGIHIDVYWVFRPFSLAVEGMIRRAASEGRYLTLDRMVALHSGSRQTVLLLMSQLADLDRLTITVLNRGRDSDAHVPTHDIPNLLNPTHDEVTHEVAYAQFQTLERHLNIPEDLRTRLIRRSPH